MSVTGDDLLNTYTRKDKRVVKNTHVSKDKHATINAILGGILLMSLLSLLAYGIYYLSLPDTWPIKKINVVGEFRNLSPSRLQTLVTDEVKGGFFNVNVTEVNDELTRYPWVEHVSVNRVWPDTLRVNVKERIAVARWGKTGLLNADAVHFVPPPATIPNDLPMLNGPEGSYQLLLDRFNELNSILNKVNFNLVELSLTERRAWEFKLDTGIVVVLGKSDYAKRIKRFSEVVVKALSGQISKVKKIDMRYTNGFAIEWIDSSSKSTGEQFDG